MDPAASTGKARTRIRDNPRREPGFFRDDESEQLTAFGPLTTAQTHADGHMLRRRQLVGHAEPYRAGRLSPVCRPGGAQPQRLRQVPWVEAALRRPAKRRRWAALTPLAVPALLAVSEQPVRWAPPAFR